MVVQSSTLSLAARKRKKALIDLGFSQASLARKLGVSEALVSAVVLGRRVTGSEAQRVMAHIAQAIGEPVAAAFPDAPVVVESEPPADRRDGAERRRFATASTERRTGDRRLA